MPEEQELVYERKRGMQYIVQNSTEKETKFGKKVTQGIMAQFWPQSDLHQMGVFNVTKYVDDWVQYEINAGNIGIGDEKAKEKKKKELTNAIVEWIENHQDFHAGIIWKKKSKEDLIADMEKSIQSQQEALEKMRADAKEMPEEQLEKITDPDKAKPDGMVTGGGIIEQGSVATGRGKPGRPKKK